MCIAILWGVVVDWRSQACRSFASQYLQNELSKTSEQPIADNSSPNVTQEKVMTYLSKHIYVWSKDIIASLSITTLKSWHAFDMAPL